MKKLMLVLALGLAVVMVNAQDTTKKKSSTPAKPATQNNVKRTPVKTSDLLKPISEDIDANYKDYKIMNALKAVKGDVTTYEVNIQKGADTKTKIKLIYDADGKFLEKKVPPVKPAPVKATPATNPNSSTSPSK
jgi:hypothetical protein